MLQASHVSRQLRLLGFSPLGSGTPRSRQGLRVSQSRSKVRVCADLDHELHAHEMALDAFQALEEAGFACEFSPCSDADYAFYVLDYDRSR